MSSRERLTVQPPDQPVRVLLVSPYGEDHFVLPQILNHPHWEWQRSRGCSQAMELLATRAPAVLFCERDQPDGCWQDLLERGTDMAAPPPVIICSRQADERLWAEVLNRGGYDVLVKPFDREEVLRVALGAWHASKRPRGRVAEPGRKAAGSTRAARLTGAA